MSSSIPDIDRECAEILLTYWTISTFQVDLNIARQRVNKFMVDLAATEQYQEIADLFDPEKLDIFCLSVYIQSTLPNNGTATDKIDQAAAFRKHFHDTLAVPFKHFKYTDLLGEEVKKHGEKDRPVPTVLWE